MTNFQVAEYVALVTEAAATRHGTGAQREDMPG